MKKKIILCSVAFLLVCVIVLLVLLGGTPKLQLKDGVYRTQSVFKKDIGYREAPSTYRASSILKNKTVYLANDGLGEDFSLNAIENADTERWLADANYTLFYNEEYPLPTLSEMKPCAISLCLSMGKIAEEKGRLDQKQADQVAELVRLLSEGKSYPKGTLLLAEYDTYELLFHSEEYPDFYYVLQYLKFRTPFSYTDGDQTVTEEKGVVYDRVNGCFYPIGEILEEYFISASGS